jgi:CBS domain-containing protein
MNVLFFLTPKSEVDCAFEDDTLSQAWARMENHKYSAIPIINETTGRYVGTLTADDLIRDLRERGTNKILKLESSRPVMSVKRKRDYRAISASARIEELYKFAMTQNFVPVVDDTETFIGIVTRTSIIQYLVGRVSDPEED